MLTLMSWLTNIRPYWRKMTWVLIAWCAAIIAWAISASVNAHHEISQCVHSSQGLLTQADCTNATNAGAGIAIVAILAIGFFGFVFFSLIWFMSRPREAR